MARATIAASQQPVASIVRWYFDVGRVEGVPFYCDPKRIGAFAVDRFIASYR